MRKSLPMIISQKIVNDYLFGKTIGDDSRLPTQLELQKRYYVSRTTILKAIDILREENLIYSIQGKGMYFTSECNALCLSGVYSYDYQLFQNGILVDNQLLSSRVSLASKEIADKLNIPRGEKVIEIIQKKVNRKTGSEVLLQCSYLRYDRFENLDLNSVDKRLYSLLTKNENLKVTDASEQIMISQIKREHSKYLEATYGDVMQIERISQEGELIVEYTTTYLLENSVKYSISHTREISKA